MARRRRTASSPRPELFWEDEMAGFHLGGDEESESGRTFTRTVFESIFHDGLQDEAGDKSVSSACGSGDSGL